MVLQTRACLQCTRQQADALRPSAQGVTYSAKRNTLFLAMSYWTSGSMLPTLSSSGAPNTADIGGSQDINLPAVPCGCVYALPLDSSLSAVSMTALVCGVAQAADSNGNTCATNSIASPDNVAIMEDFDTLIIGEDTGNHRLDYMWQYAFPNAATSAAATTLTGGSLTPIFSTMMGSETTSPFWHNLGNGFGYLTAVIQHPYGESDNAWAAMPTSSGVAAYMGYIGPIPVNSGCAAPPPPPLSPPPPPPSSPPPPPPSPPALMAVVTNPSTAVLVSATMTLAGVTAAQFNAAAQTAFIAVLAPKLAVTAAAITVTGVSDVASAGRHLLQTGGVNVAFKVATTDSTSAAAVYTSVMAAPSSSSFVASLNTALVAAGAPATTGVSLPALPAVGGATGAASAAAPLRVGAALLAGVAVALAL